MTDRSLEPAGVEIIQVKNDLKERLRAPGGKSLQELVAKGQSSLDAMAKDYPAVARRDIEELRRIFTDMVAHPENSKLQRQFDRVTHNIKGIAGSYGYHLLTEVADSLATFSDRLIWANTALVSQPRHVEVVHLHIATLDLAMKRGLKGTNTDEAKALLDGLRKAVDKVTDTLPPIDHEALRRQTLGRV